MYRLLIAIALIATVSRAQLPTGTVTRAATEAYVTNRVAIAVAQAVTQAGTNTQAAISSKVSLTDATYTATVARAASALQVETDAIALNAISTNRITKLWDTTGTQFIDATGAVWRITTVSVTNYAFSILSVLNSYGNAPAQTWYDELPISEYGWSSEIGPDTSYLWYDKGGMGQCAWVAYMTFDETNINEMNVAMYLSTQIPAPPEGIAYLYRIITSTLVTNSVLQNINAGTVISITSTTEGTNSAGFFSGNGGGLTDIPASAIIGLSSGNITNQTWGAAGTNATYQMSWDTSNGTFRVVEILP